jgi:hypothetical protein
MDDLESRYQIPEDAQPVGEIFVDAELIDLETGVELIDANTQEQLTGETFQVQALADGEGTIPTVVTNDEGRPAVINITNRNASEVSTTLLGLPREETALGLFDAVNIYGINSKEWASGPLRANYAYAADPTDYTFADDFGYYWRHLPYESALQAYTFPPPFSFVYPIDDNSGRFPGGNTNGTMTTYWESKRAFRYQPGRVTGFTLGVRMSTQSGDDGEIIQWGCRNGYGDGYFFQLEKGTDLFIVRTSPDLGELKVPREQWNGDKLLVGEGATGWGLDLSRVTMFKIEFSWYGAVGAQFLAYVPDGNGEARWVKLHYIFAENRFETPSLRSAYMRLFTSCRSIAGATQPAFINLYGSSVYIDGGDKGTVTIGSAALDTAKNIDATDRSILGLQVKGQINGVDNQKAVYPVSLAAFASVPARFDLVLQGNGINAGESYFYGNGTNLTRGASSPIAVTLVGGNVLQINAGQFPDISAEVSGSTNYLTGKRVRVTGTNIFNTHVTAINSGLTQITTDRPLPSTTSSIRLSRFDAFATASGVIPSGVASGTVFFNTGEGQWRIGAAWNGSTGEDDIVWFASKYTGLNFNRQGNVIGEQILPLDPYRQASFSIAFPSGTSDSVLTFGGSSRTLSGITSPWPISLVAQLMDSSQLNDVVVVQGTAEERIVPGSGATEAIASWTVVSGVSQDSTSAGGSSYVANKFEASSSDPLSAVLVDTQGYRTLRSPRRIATYFLGSGETKQFDLSNLFGPDKMYITGAPGTPLNSGALFVVATARGASGVASATLNWEEQ